MKGDDATGWALFGGLPATLMALAVNPPLGLLVGAATVSAWKYGRHQQAVEDLQRLAAGSPGATPSPALIAARKEWDDEFDQLMQMRESGEYEDDLLDELEVDLFGRYPMK